MQTIALCATVVLGAAVWWAATITLIRLFGFHRSPDADRIITLLGGIILLLIGVGLLTTSALSIISALLSPPNSTC